MTTSGGAFSPGITTLALGLLCKSAAIAFTAAAGTEEVPGATATPTAAASAEANPTTSDGFTGHRWSALAPVIVIEDSIEYRRFISPVTGASRRPSANWRAS